MTARAAAQPLTRFIFQLDRRTRRAVLPYRHSPPVKAIDWLSKIGDQPQMRVLGGGVVLAGVVRHDARMIGAGVRMLAAHELATAGKTWVKQRIVRTRPRNPEGGNVHKPRPGHDMRKEKSSFPSGHSAGAMASAVAFAQRYPQHAPAAVAAAGAVALGRIPSCKHYPSDVAAGAMIGLVAASIVGAGSVLLRAIIRR